MKHFFASEKNKAKMGASSLSSQYQSSFSRFISCKKPSVLLFWVWRSTLLVVVQTTREISEKSINANLLEPIVIFNIRILMEVEVQVFILVSESVWMHLQRVMIYGFVNY